MTAESDGVQRARRRRGNGTVDGFDGRRLSLARRLRGMPRTMLAARTSVTAASITQFERGTRPSDAVLAELALALGMPAEFFRPGRPIEQVPASAAHFRSLRATPAASRDQALAFAEIALAVVDVLEQYVDLPAVTDIVDPVHEEPTPDEIVATAARTRARLGVDPGPLPHSVRLLEAHGVVVLRLPPEIDTKVDAFSTEAGHRPLVLLSPAKDDRARSRFDAAHELGHLVMHHDVEPGSKITERQADQFASEFLAPTAELEPDLPRAVEWDALLHAKTKWGVSLAALVYRAHSIGIWSEHAYRRANQYLRDQGYPEPGALGPPESPYMLGAAINLLTEAGRSTSELARVSGLTAEQFHDVISAGTETNS
ncbi:ImmA/IrrE family metallo-endopeptidase [Phytoactinopolyspora alkaliphila]|uniref:ImmA/IrrE family metallo-endopeptidase n=1 Tax=Phytoactinopolyspora alkaliphila TaxID=1783498 RepID=A0A6N9YMA8_9ACTN|nr:ImmA/IrrE family metallo-endopeptidase [Phytoactinopolyspora alkaliphila]NED96102.1 ImmA/IrrE family metallo-endopeptidase [Phytoactinopolyspora alkaliphila]